jgi:hypothetical protein
MRLPPVAREVVRGLAAGLGFLAAWLVLETPWWLAGGLAAGVYWSASLLLPAPPPPPEPVMVAPGITVEEHDTFVAQCAASAAKLDQLARQLAAGDFRLCVAAAAHTTARLADYFRQRPESILAALGLPLHLDHLLKLLQQYVELSHNQSVPVGGLVAEALQQVEQTVENATLAFDGMYRQLLDNDVAALQASAGTLEYLLGVKPDPVRTRHQPPSSPLAELNPPLADPTPRQRSQLEKPS